jgi:hypothetical protein
VSIDPVLFLFVKGKKLDAERAADRPSYGRDVDHDRCRLIRDRQSQDQQHVVVHEHVACYLASSDREIAGGAIPFGIPCKGDRELDVQPCRESSTGTGLIPV